MTTTAAAITALHPYTKINFVYDWQGRRVARTVWQGGNSTTPTFKSNRRWLYDGWNVIAEFSATSEIATTSTRLNTFTWGLDLSGNLRDAGGVGGLLSQNTVTGGAIHRASYDGNGNIVAWTKSDQTVPIHRREYDAFGNTLISEGTSPSTFGFSTKMQDAETALYYYGYRYYDPSNGRWLGRDPIGERGGLNLYAFLANNSVDWADSLGQIKIPKNHFTLTRTVKNEKGRMEKQNLMFGFTVEELPGCKFKAVIPMKFTIPISGHGSQFTNLDRDKQRALGRAENDNGMTAQESERAATKKRFEDYNKEIGNAWNNKALVKCEKCECPGGYSVSVELKSSPDGDNVWEVAFIDYEERFSNQFTWNTNPLHSTNVAAHEVGHFLGNFDDYTSEKSSADTGSIMTSENGTARPRHFDQVAAMIGKKLNTKCTAVSK